MIENGTTTKDSTNMKNGPYLQEWLIYTLCIGGFVLIIVLSHFLRSYRRLPSSTKADETEKNDTRHDAVQSPYIRNTAIYDEIDEYMLEDDRGESTTVQNLKRIHSNDNINDNQSDNTIIKQEESSSYLEPVFVEKENETRNSFKESSLGLSSNTYCTTPVRTRFYNRNEFRQESADGYEVPVHVHKYESSSAAMSREEESLSNPCYNVYQQLLGDQNTNNNAYEESIKLYNEKDINIDETHIQDKLAITKRDRDPMDCLIHVVTTTRSREEVKHPKIELCCSQTKMGQNSENKAGNSENV
ncbi:Hypothetical predicted protein [Mytilus galloprovincialis]|uniref:Uncharacterized protein n=1 Tax=Mytilus galloprovincialis TaxID=29158 RepID=A0A8B6GXB5_MYTGA|nr:Hypothetical predicted protein [Mytilus galloprovincialis]